ncbi:alpha-amylase family glycosyl hydrolase [Thiospirillum jenense]|uniref:Alpha-amylase n=1 Tax=Thiospirillum jenense TaxID=1653858 RepID=A0A839HC35_9GAMM|nr:alpha-amylase family glycosyl hydrolase [Thiospirillum jenense]MBB1126231.1 alpha-amylase [Thiospirillum jenense]
MKIYNLFPLLAGDFSRWPPHLDRAAAMGFDWVFVNPIQQLGRSGSLYSIADYLAINPTFVTPNSDLTPDDQVRAVAAQAQSLGLGLITDLVINHCAIDSPLVTKHPEWFVLKHGQPTHPFCVEQDGSKVIWEDLAQFDHRKSPARPKLLDYCAAVIEHLISLGFRGFRCDAAYQIPAEFWRELIALSRANHPDLIFIAETLGCSPKQMRTTAAAGFDAIYNSAKWWDFDGEWLLDQYALTRTLAGSIAFPESHDTDRLLNETYGNVNALRQRYLFTALFSSHVMMTMGFEYGARRRLHVVNTRPEDWEAPNCDLTDFITHINGIKDRYPVLSSEAPIERLEHPHNPAILILRKCLPKSKAEALLIINKDPWNEQHFYTEDLYRLIRATSLLIDVSPDWPMDYLPTPFNFTLGPGMARVLVNDASLAK